jgi:hypothetical protein
MLSRLLNKNKNAPPAYEKKRFFASEEKAFYTRLRRALPSCYIFPDIELSALITPASTDPRQKRAELNLLIGRKVNYAVFDANLSLLCVIELTSPDSAGDEAASNEHYLKSAGIKRICWSGETRPATEEILRALAPFAQALQSKPDPAADLSVGQADAVGTANPDTLRATQPSEPAHVHISCLSVAAIEYLTPRANIKTDYPHVWQRICLFCINPNDLAQYLTSLTIQDRGENRAGFPHGVIMEITDIQHANERYLQNGPSHRAWNTVFVR